MQAVYASPDDDLPRLVFADNLNESGEPERAELIRVQCRLDRLPDCRICVGSAELVAGPGKVVPCPVCERPALRRRQQEVLAADRYLLLEPADRDAFELLSFRPLYRRGFLSGAILQPGDPWHYDPPLYPVEEVVDDWHRLSDVAGRTPLFDLVRAVGWFTLDRAGLRFDRPWPCPTCRGEGGDDCPDCLGNRELPPALTLRGGIDPFRSGVMRWEVGRELFDRDHPHFQGDRGG